MPDNEQVITAPLSEDDRRLQIIFETIETNQLTTLDEATKGVVDRVSTMLAVVFAVTAFGDSFPPPYLNDILNRWLLVITLLTYLGAMAIASRALAPRFYQLFRHNLSGMRAELNKIIESKYRLSWWAGLLFWIGTTFFAALTLKLIFVG